MAINYPVSLDDNASLQVAKNNLYTTLTAQLLVGEVTTMEVASTTGWDSSGYLSIDSEIIKYTSTDATHFLTLIRAQDDTSAAQHEIDVVVELRPIAMHHNNLKDSVVALETKVGVDSSAVATTIDYLLKNASSMNPGHLHNALTFTNTGLHILDTNASHDLIISPGSDLTGDKTLTLTTGDANRSLTIESDSIISQDYSSDASPTFAGLTLTAFGGIVNSTAGVLSGSAVILTPGTNTFNITKGTAILDIAAGSTLNIDVGLQVTTNAGILDFTGAGKTLTIEDNATVSQDYSSDASPEFAGLTLTAFGGIVNSAAGVLSGSEVILTPGANTFNITKGTAVLDIAAGATLNIDDSFKVVDNDTIAIGMDYPATLLLWTKLESASDITSPQVGNAGTNSGSTFALCKFNNGAECGLTSKYFNFPTSTLGGDTGCIEFWFKAGAAWTGVFSWKELVDSFKSGTGISRGIDFYGSTSLVFKAYYDGGYAEATYVYSFVEGDVVHIAISWDKNAGIDGTKSIVLYQDGVERASDTKVLVDWGHATTVTFGQRTWNGNRGADGIFDNIKSWNYAKTDFSDREIEDPIVPNVALTVEADSVINQDLTTDASPTFAGVTVGNTGLHILDTNASHDLIIKPGMDLTVDSTLILITTVDRDCELKLLGDLTINANQNQKLTITTGAGDRLISILGNLNIESASVINQDLTTDATPTFAGVITTGGVAAGNNEALKWDVVFKDLDGTSPDSVACAISPSVMRDLTVGIYDVDGSAFYGTGYNQTPTEASTTGLYAYILVSTIYIIYGSSYAVGDDCYMIVYY